MIALSSPSPSPSENPVSSEALAASEVANGEEQASSLSRNTSVISTTSSSSSSSSLAPPQRTRPIRTYTGPQAKNVPDVVPASPTTPKGTQRNFDDYFASGGSSRASPTPPGVAAQMATAIAKGINGLAVPGLFGGQSTGGTSTPITRAQSPGINGLPNGVRSRQASASNGVQNYRFDGVLGEGSYSTVFVATSLINQQVYAVKVISKRLLQKENKVRYATSERAILSKLGAANHPGIIKLYSAFQDANSLYFATELAPNGELFTQIRKLGSFDITGTRYYAATILDAVSFIHRMNIIHRDLKPENILLDANMRIKISDFGSAKDKSIAVVINSNDAKATKGSFVGTPEYASPEMLVPPTITTRASDIWAYGCIVFQFVAGRPPFKESTDYLTMKKIQEGKYHIPDGFDPVVRTVVEGCLVIDPTVRITSQALKEHIFFESTDWDTIWKVLPPKLESGLVPPPPKSPEDDNLHLDLTWTMDGSENEMEDLRPAQDYRHHHENTIPLPITGDNPVDLDFRPPFSSEGRSGLDMTPTREKGDHQLPPFDPSSTPIDARTLPRRFSNDASMPLITPMDPGSAVIFTPASERPGKGRRPSSSSDVNPRPRRTSPSVLEGRQRPRSQGFVEGDESSEQWSAESPPSTVELHGPSLDAIEESASGLGVKIDGSASLPLSRDGNNGSSPSATDAGLTSTSGTSKGSTTSGSLGGSTSRGFERIRGIRGVDLGYTYSDRGLSGEGWVRRDGTPLLGPDETSVTFTSVTTRIKRGLLPPKQRRRLLMLTSFGRLLCLKEIKSTSGKKKAEVEENVYMRLLPPPSGTPSIEPSSLRNAAYLSADSFKSSVPLDTPIPSKSGSGSPSKRSSLIGLSFGSPSSSVTSAFSTLSLSLPGSSRSQSNASVLVGSPPSGSSPDPTTYPRTAAVCNRVEARGETGFAIYCGDRVLIFGVDSPGAAINWLDKLRKAMETQ